MGTLERGHIDPYPLAHRAEYVGTSVRGHIGPWVHRSVGTSVRWHIGLSTWAHRSVGTSVRWYIGPRAHRSAGTSVRWHIGPRAHRSVGTSVRPHCDRSPTARSFACPGRASVEWEQRALAEPVWSGTADPARSQGRSGPAAFAVGSQTKSPKA